MSLQRLTCLDNGEVLYRGKFHPGLGRGYQLICGLEFLAMLVPQLTLRYECRIFCYGAISTTICRQLGWIKKEETSQAPKTVVVIEEEESQFAKVRRKNWARVIAKVWLEDPSLYPSGGKETTDARIDPESRHARSRVVRGQLRETLPKRAICFLRRESTRASEEPVVADSREKLRNRGQRQSVGRTLNTEAPQCLDRRVAEVLSKIPACVPPAAKR